MTLPLCYIFYCNADKGFAEQCAVLISKGPSALPCLPSGYLVYDLLGGDRCRKEAWRKRWSGRGCPIMSSPPHLLE